MVRQNIVHVPHDGHRKSHRSYRHEQAGPDAIGMNYLRVFGRNYSASLPHQAKKRSNVAQQTKWPPGKARYKRLDGKRFDP